ncbi:hypothetical protein LRAMOSA00295 [Lichtheimia ramosa]|uniref:Agmatinase n=1 Tax=Lichtheimia ramosa TaxID=688394 RepID=A0A077W9W4_9FUNG|nr:hypothetical protein LRAMOSA00295 [Lichtheimia ramosa]
MYRSLSLTFCALTILHTVCATPMLPLMQSYAAIQHSDNTHAAIHSFANDYKDNKHVMLDKNDLVFNTMFAVSESQDDTHANDDSNHKKNRQGTFKKEDLVTNPVAADSLYAGLGTFSHLPYVQCLQNDSLAYDIAFIGAPFDSGVSYRPGARFGPAAIREGSRRTLLTGGYNVPQKVDPFSSWATVLDCGDIFMTPFDKELALRQLQYGYASLLDHPTADIEKGTIPRLLTMGGDHTITLPILRALHAVYGPVSVIHFDSHLDSWNPAIVGVDPDDDSAMNHGMYFWHASKEGLINKGASIHAGIRNNLVDAHGYEEDHELGFRVVEAREIDDIGVHGVIERIRECVGDNYVYLSIDIDTLDPAYAPATGTPESGGWSSREFRTILRGLEGLNIVGADLVEVSPAYDTNAQITAFAAADLLYETLSLMVRHPVKQTA